MATQVHIIAILFLLVLLIQKELMRAQGGLSFVVIMILRFVDILLPYH
jgi:hypothetical protein